MSCKGDLQELETEVLRHMPADVMQALERRDRQEPLVRHVVQSAITRLVTDIDRRTLEVLTAKIMADTAAVKAMTEARRAVHELRRVEHDLGQQAELHDLQHETARLVEQDTQEKMRLRVVHREHAVARLKAQGAWLERELNTTDPPKPSVTNKWEALLQAFKGDATGIADFQAQTDQWLAEYREKQCASIREEDPLRAEKLARIEALVGELQALRDRMLRESWGLPDSPRDSSSGLGLFDSGEACRQ